MKREHIFLLFTLLLTLLSFYLLYRILLPFLVPLLWAVLLATLFFPLTQKLHRILKKKKVLSSAIMTLLVVWVIVLPAGFLMISLAHEVIDFYHWLEGMIQAGELQDLLHRIGQWGIVQWLLERLSPYIDFRRIDFMNLFLKNVQQIGTFLLNQTSTLLKGISSVVIGFFFTLLSLYYLFKDGDQLWVKLKEMIPLPSKERDLIIQRFKEMVYAAIFGGLCIALIQGILGGLSFWVLGLPSPIFWGTAMAFLSFIPIGGTALIWGPAALFLLFQGTFLKGLILLGLGIFIIGMVDNFLRPYFISAKTNIHPLLLFFAILGGIHAFGMIGLVVGPLIVTLFLTLVEIYIQGTKSRKNLEEKI